MAWNRIACDVLTDYSAIPSGRREALRLLFQDPEFRTKTFNWEHVSKVSLSFFRKTYDRFARLPWYSKLVADIRKGSPEFAERWSLHEVADKNGLQIEIHRSEMGRLQFEMITFNQINDQEHLMSCIYAPVPGTGTLEKMLEASGAGPVPSASWLNPDRC